MRTASQRAAGAASESDLGIPVMGGPPRFWECPGWIEHGRLLPDNGPLSCWVGVVLNLDNSLLAPSCCLLPETDAQEPLMSALEVTLGAALSLHGRAPEREGGQ